MLPPLLMCLSVDIKSYLFPSLACDQHVSPYSRNISWREGAMSGQDATLTEGKRKWSHLSPTRSWKEMGNSEGKRWSAFCYISVDGEASHYSSPPALLSLSKPYPCGTGYGLHWLLPLQPAVNRWVAQSRPICHAWWCIARNMKIFFLCGVFSSDSENAVKRAVVCSTRRRGCSPFKPPW